MKKSIAYDEQDLQNNFKFMLNHIADLEDEILRMEEQGLGLRDNYDWRSSGKRLRIALEQVKIGLNHFGVTPLKAIDLNGYNYENQHLTLVEENFLEHQASRILNDEGD
jgi:hypothetical protein